jgi:hypothetical protein
MATRLVSASVRLTAMSTAVARRAFDGYMARFLAGTAVVSARAAVVGWAPAAAATRQTAPFRCDAIVRTVSTAVSERKGSGNDHESPSSEVEKASRRDPHAPRRCLRM